MWKAIAKGLTKLAVWAVKNPDDIIQIVNVVKDKKKQKA